MVFWIGIIIALLGFCSTSKAGRMDENLGTYSAEAVLCKYAVAIIMLLCGFYLIHVGW